MSDWDNFLSIDLSSNSHPLKTAADFLRNRDFANLVAESDIPTPTHFVEQALCFCRNICALLLSHKVCKSKLVRGFSIFDEAIVRHGEEEDYSRECEMLCDFFVESKWISSNVKPLIYSEYRSFVAQFRSNIIEHDREWVDFLSGYYEMHCRENLFFAFKLCCLSLANHSSLPPHFTLILPRLASDADEFRSSVRSIQSSLSGIPNVSGLFSNPRTISPVFSLLGKGNALLSDATFSVWMSLPPVLLDGAYCLTNWSRVIHVPSPMKKLYGLPLWLAPKHPLQGLSFQVVNLCNLLLFQAELEELNHVVNPKVLVLNFRLRHFLFLG